ncbi:MarR family transcriptional regulator [uncultured Methanoregula sp.]|uniref:MarR family transcriptional regulator n=1 Tax=uncultured Methanoregula sp. TaxID=1005933 RepID=UPI002AABFCE9|nr:MarR family transcriptional regulator [uncultured Methanoregula sp.]
MREREHVIFSDEESEFFDLLTMTGTRNNIAKILVFLANTPEGTSREIERRMHLRQPEVSIAIKYLAARSWIRYREIPPGGKGRPVKNYSLAVPFGEIITIMEKEKRDELNFHLGRIRKIREYSREVSG